MPWIRKISHLSLTEKAGIFRLLIPPSLYHRFWIDPLSFCDLEGRQRCRIFSPRGDRTCLVELTWPSIQEPLYSIQLTDGADRRELEWDFVIVNDPESPAFNTQVDGDGRDTLFGWASRNKGEEEKALKAGLFPGQTRRGLRITGEVLDCLIFFCRIFDIKAIRLEALFYHNAITYERYGFAYYEGYHLMRRIHELFQPGEHLYNRLDGSTPFRSPEFGNTVRGRSWAIHDGILSDLKDDVIQEGWESPVMYRMIDKTRPMITFPNPVY
jgi:hypothetical protein